MRENLKTILTLAVLGAMLFGAIIIGGYKEQQWLNAHKPYNLGAAYATSHHATLAKCEYVALNIVMDGDGQWLKGCFDYAVDAVPVRVPS